eukprot:6202141-Pleurochrysis_carterae.AAC.1
MCAHRDHRSPSSLYPHFISVSLTLTLPLFLAAFYPSSYFYVHCEVGLPSLRLSLHRRPRRVARRKARSKLGARLGTCRFPSLVFGPFRVWRVAWVQACVAFGSGGQDSGWVRVRSEYGRRQAFGLGPIEYRAWVRPRRGRGRRADAARGLLKLGHSIPASSVIKLPRKVSWLSSDHVKVMSVYKSRH